MALIEFVLLCLLMQLRLQLSPRIPKFLTQTLDHAPLWVLDTCEQRKSGTTCKAPCSEKHQKMSMWQETRALWITSELLRRTSAKRRKGWDHLANFQTCLFSPGCEPWTTAGFLQPASSVPPLSLSGRSLCRAQSHKPQPAIPFTLCSTGKKTSTLGETLVWIEISC